MNFDVSKSYFIPFALAKKEVKDSFLDFLIESDDAPVNVAYKASNISINKVYYPVRCFDIEYSADWSATSIWEHKEEYTEYEPRTIYIDYNGKEHNKPGFDCFKNGSYTGTSSFGGEGKRPWRAQQRMVPVTKYNTVVDNVEQTCGNIGRNRSFQPIITFSDESERSLAEWIVNTDIEGNYLPVHSDLMQGCEILNLVHSDETAKNTAISNVSSIASGQCEREVPGTRYTDLSVFNFRAESDMQIVLIPIFHIVYEYAGQQFECWANGVAARRFFYYTRPEDDNIKNEIEQQTVKIKEQKKQWWKWMLISFVAMPVVLFISLVSAFAAGGLPSLIIAIVFEVIFVKKYRTVNKELKIMRETKENYLAKLREKRIVIAAIMKNDELSDEDKSREAEKILGTDK